MKHSFSYLVVGNFLWATRTSPFVSAQTGQVSQRLFADDAGILHKTTKAKSTIICSKRTALSLLHQFGIDSSQIVGTYGGSFPRGSIVDIDDPNYQPYWPVDPTEEELDFLAGILDLSPSCSTQTQSKCEQINVASAISTEADLWLYIDNGAWHTGKDMKLITDAMGTPPIIISTHYEGNSEVGCITYDPDTATYKTDIAKCISRSLNDVIKRTNEVGSFLGIEKVDIQTDQKLMCTAAEALTVAARSAHLRGIRVMAINPSVDINNIVTVYPVSPLADPFLRTYEELGVPIIHPVAGKNIPVTEWFTDCQPGELLENCNDHIYYPVDLWLVEGRRFYFNSPEEAEYLETFFPDRALLKNQISHWPVNDGPISYTVVTRIFREMTKKLDETIRLYDTTVCTTADVTSDTFLDARTGGLQGGQYACYDAVNLQMDYLDCKSSDLAGGTLTQTSTTTTSTSEQQQNPSVNFAPPISNKGGANNLSSKQITNTMWSTDGKKKINEIETSGINEFVLAFITVIALAGCTGIFICFLYCCCWENNNKESSMPNASANAVDVSDTAAVVETIEAVIT